MLIFLSLLLPILSEEVEEFIDNPDENFDHLKDIVSPEELDKLNSLTQADKVFLMEQYLEKMDVDKDDFLEENEIHSWIHYVEQMRVFRDVQKHLPQFDEDKDGFISLDEYNKQTFDWVDDPELSKQLSADDLELVKATNYRDTRRFIEADSDHDGQLSDTEFGAFLHPHTQPHMQDVLSMETLEEMDRDGNGKIDIEEYISHVGTVGQTEDQEWLDQERNNFNKHLDKDGDGFMAHHEVSHWIRPNGNTPIDFEVQHLLLRVDINEDGRLSRREVLDNYHHFFRSQATEWGQNVFMHDEL